MQIVNDVTSRQSLKESAKSCVMGAIRKGINNIVSSETAQPRSETQKGQTYHQKSKTSKQLTERNKRRNIIS